jgi:hypothetical protein
MESITLAANPPITADAQVRVVTDQALITFPDASVHFDGANGGVIPKLISDHAFASTFSNMNVKLTWSVSFDGWQTALVFTSYQRIFVTLATPAGSAGGLGFPAQPHVTAARLNKVTTDLQGIASAPSATSTTSSNVHALIPFGGGSLGDYGGDPWAVLDNPRIVTGGVLDCISLSAITLVQLLQAGVAANLSLAFPTTDLDATSQEKTRISGKDSKLDFYLSNGISLNDFEAYLFLCEGASATTAYTVSPLAGPYGPLLPGVVDVCGPNQPPPQNLAFSVIGSVLLGIQKARSNPNGGRQWWISLSDGTVVQGPVAFPAGYIEGLQ